MGNTKKKSVRRGNLALREIRGAFLAKLSARQHIAVAIIGLVSAIAVASIANFDKLRSSKLQIDEEIGYFEARVGIVVDALHQTENELQKQEELAQKRGDVKEAKALRGLIAEAQRTETRVPELHEKHLFEIRNGNRLSASKTKTGLNEAIWSFRLSQEALLRSDLVLYVGHGGYAGYGTIPSVPLYGKQAVDSRGQVCKIENENLEIEQPSSKSDLPSTTAEINEIAGIQQVP